MTHSTTIVEPAGHEHDDSSSHHAQHGETLRTYYLVYGALIVLLVLTMAASYVPLGHRGNLALAMSIAVCKGLLVVLFFMHVRQASRLTAVFASAAFLWLAILFIITFSDYFTRPHNPGGSLSPEPFPVQERPSQGPHGVETNREFAPDIHKQIPPTTPEAPNPK
jgi:cytochrome c oxidase subunit 4